MNSIRQPKRINSTRVLPLFIEKFQSYPCLWEVNNPDYHDLFKKERAYNRFARDMKVLLPDCDVLWVKKKICQLKNCFWREVEKVQEAQRLGESYVPKIWYFQKLLFLNNQKIPRRAKTQKIPYEKPKYENKYEDKGRNPTPGTSLEVAIEPMEIGGRCSTIDVESLSDEGKEENMKDEIISSLKKNEDDYDKFGAFIAAKLRKMGIIERVHTQHMILLAIAGGDLGKFGELFEMQFNQNVKPDVL